MGTKSEFQQILEGKMAIPRGEINNSRGETAENSGESTSFSEEKSDFPEGKSVAPQGRDKIVETLIASLLEAGVNFNFSQSSMGAKSRHGDIYPRKTPTPRTARPRPNEKTALVKDLNPEANQAFCHLRELGATEFAHLEIVSESIVKRAFRRLALKLHPDQNPKANGLEFRSAREAYATLLKALT